MIERLAMNPISGYSRLVSCFKGIYFSIAVYVENAFWAHGIFLLQCLECPLEKFGVPPYCQSGMQF